MPVEMEIVDIGEIPVLSVTPLNKEAFQLDYRLDRRIEEEMNRRFSAIVVNLEKIDKIDSLGLGALTGLHLKYHKNNPVVFVNMKPFVKELIRTAGMSKILAIFSSLDQGLDYLRSELKQRSKTGESAGD